MGAWTYIFEWVHQTMLKLIEKAKVEIYHLNVGAIVERIKEWLQLSGSVYKIGQIAENLFADSVEYIDWSNISRILYISS